MCTLKALLNGACSCLEYSDNRVIYLHISVVVIDFKCNIPNYRISGNFRCKNIFVVAINHENFIHEIIFTRVNSYYSQNLFAMLASYFARWPASLDSYLQPRDGIASKHATPFLRR